MPLLEIRLLGFPQIRLDGQPVEDLPVKARALLFYLVVNKQQFSREHLAELLWSDEKMPLDKKLNNLRGSGALLSLKRVLGDFLVIRRHSLAFRGESDYWLDVVDFEAALGDPNPTQVQLQTAVDLYQDDFLTGLTLRQASGFEEWEQRIRERLRRLAMNALYMLAVHYKQQRQYPAGIECITRLLALEPYFEEAHREYMTLLGRTDQVSEACLHYERYEALLAEEGLEPESETLAVYQQLVRGEIVPDDTAEPIIQAEPRQPWSPPFQPPARIPHFVGRQGLMQEILTALGQADQMTIQALIGMGGVGKSSLVIEIAHAAQPHFPDGILWASVATSEPTAVIESWAAAYGYDFSRIGDLESMANAFRGILADKEVLLVLDDVSSASRLRPLLPNGEGTQVLITTRNQDLAAALNAQPWLLAELSAENGRLLLRHILGEERISAEPEAATDICDLLQNLPLALEIIGQRLRSRPRRKMADVVQRLRDEKQRLSELQISDREVRASFALSYATLDADLKQMFALMGVFNGRRFTAEALAAIAEQDRYEAEDHIFALVALSLAGEVGDIRYSQHPLLADFAREKLELREDMEEVYGRFALHYLQFAQQHQHDYDALRPEWDNLMAAMETAHDYELWQTVIAFADALHDAWFDRARYSQAKQAYQWVKRASKTEENDDNLVESLINLARICIEQNDLDLAQIYLEEATQISNKMESEVHLANIYLFLSRIAFEKNEFEQSALLLAKSQVLKETQQDKVGLAAILYRRARICLRQGNYDEALQLIDQTLSIQTQENDLHGLLKTKDLLALLYIEKKEHLLAKSTCVALIELAEKLNRKEEYAIGLDKMAVIHRRLGEFQLAHDYAEQSLAVFRQIGSRKFQGLSLYTLSIVKEDMIQYKESLEVGHQSLQLLEEIEDHYSIALLSIHLGDLYYQLNELEKSRLHWQKAKSIFTTINNSTYELKLQKRLNKLNR